MDELKHDPDIEEASLSSERSALLAAVKVDGYALRSASKRLRADREIILAAVKQNGKALVFAHESLKCDKELVMEAVAEGGHVALWHASEELQKDKEVLLAVK